MLVCVRSLLCLRRALRGRAKCVPLGWPKMVEARQLQVTEWLEPHALPVLRQMRDASWQLVGNAI